MERSVRPLALCALCGADKGYTLGVGDTYRWWTVCCGACGRQVDECRSDGNISMNASKPLSWPAADVAWNEAGAHAEESRANRENMAAVIVAAAVAAERERCAKIVEEYDPGVSYFIRAALAAEIRRAQRCQRQQAG